MKKILLISFVAILALTGCSKEFIEPETDLLPDLENCEEMDELDASTRSADVYIAQYLNTWGWSPIGYNPAVLKDVPRNYTLMVNNSVSNYWGRGDWKVTNLTTGEIIYPTGSSPTTFVLTIPGHQYILSCYTPEYGTISETIYCFNEY